MSAKILLWDLETAPALVYAWGRWKQNIGGNQVHREGYILCWAARFLDEDTVYYDSLPNHDLYKEDPTNDYEILRTLSDVMAEADIILAYNGDKFDVKWVNTQLAKHELPPMHPQKTIDPLKYCKAHFRFPSNKLKEVSAYLGVPQRKLDTDFGLWKGCMAGDKKSWKEMQDYNIQDLEPMAEVYLRIRPYVKTHPNLAIYEEYEGDMIDRCHKCLSSLLIRNGYYFTNISQFRRYICRKCGARDIRGTQNMLPLSTRKEIMRGGR